MTDYKGVALKAYNRIALIVDELEDEGDRVYLGSTNDADILRELKDERDANFIMGEDMLTSEQEVVALRSAVKAADTRATDGEARVEQLIVMAAEKERDAEAAAALAYERAAEVEFPDSWRDDAHAIHAGPGLKAQRTWSAGFNACRDAIRALASPSGVEELSRLRAERDASDHRAGAMLARVAALEADGDAARAQVQKLRADLEAARNLLCLADEAIMQEHGCFPLDRTSERQIFLNDACLAIRSVTGEDPAARKKRASAALAAAPAQNGGAT